MKHAAEPIRPVVTPDRRLSRRLGTAVPLAGALAVFATAGSAAGA